MPATLGAARMQLRLDVNFGDPVDPQEIEYPTLLSEEPIDLLGYPVEAVIAEKVETMISRGDANTRERDYADVLALSNVHSIQARKLRKALGHTTHAAFPGPRHAPYRPATGLEGVPCTLPPDHHAREL